MGPNHSMKWIWNEINKTNLIIRVVETQLFLFKLVLVV